MPPPPQGCGGNVTYEIQEGGGVKEGRSRSETLVSLRGVYRARRGRAGAIPLYATGESGIVASTTV